MMRNKEQKWKILRGFCHAQPLQLPAVGVPVLSQIGQLCAGSSPTDEKIWSDGRRGRSSGKCTWYNVEM